MLKFGLASLVIAAVAGMLSGCSGDVSQDDVQKTAKAQADYVKEHPDPPGAGASQ